MEIATEIINGKSRIVGTFEVPWKTEKRVENGVETDVVINAKVKIKKMNFGEYNELQRASAKMTMVGNQPKLDFDTVAMNENAILKSVIDAPYPINDMSQVKELDREVAEIILSNINELNLPTDKKKGN